MSLRDELRRLPEVEITDAIPGVLTDLYIEDTSSVEHLKQQYPVLADISVRIKETLSNLEGISEEEAELMSIGCMVGTLVLVRHAELEEMNSQYPEFAKYL